MTTKPTTPAALAWSGVVAGPWAVAITVEPLRGLTAPQRQQLDDEAGLVGKVMEATPTLTVGTVTADPHA